MSIARDLYSFLTLPISVLLGPLFFLHSRGRQRLAERYGVWTCPGQQQSRETLWFHAASAGEMAGLIPLMRLIEQRNPAAHILVTAVSVTGLHVARDDRRECHLLPFDSTVWIRRALDGRSIGAFIQSETEIWPGLLSYLSGRRVPCFLVNGKITDYSFGWYRRIRFFLAPLLREFRAVCVADEYSAQRFAAIGIPESQMRITGNTKYDRIPSVTAETQVAGLRAEFGAEGSPLLVLGSLRPGEEKVWFPALHVLIAEGAHFRAVIAPRHAEKFDYFAQELQKEGISFTRSSSRSAARHPAVLLDEFGRLESLYSIASLAFIGATLVDIGGHNPLEAAAYSVPVAMGAFDSAVRDVTEDLEERRALFRIVSSTDAEALIRRLIAHPEVFIRAGAAAKQVWETHRGAVQRTLEVIETALDHSIHQETPE